MPRYYFHFSDGKREFGDAIGCELRGLAEARQHTAVAVRDLKAVLCAPSIADLSGWSMRVADASGKTVHEIGFDFRPKMAEV
jgi:Domain of unknown function (DUF6894)